MPKRTEPRKHTESPEWGPLTDYITNGVTNVIKTRREPKDFEHYAFEYVMEALYGPNVWEWYNDLVDE